MAAYRPKKSLQPWTSRTWGTQSFSSLVRCSTAKPLACGRRSRQSFSPQRIFFPQWPNVLSHQFQILIYLNPMQMALSDHLQRCGGVVGTQGQGGPRTPSSKTFSSQTEGQLRVPKPNKNPYWYVGFPKNRHNRIILLKEVGWGSILFWTFQWPHLENGSTWCWATSWTDGVGLPIHLVGPQDRSHAGQRQSLGWHHTNVDQWEAGTLIQKDVFLGWSWS